MAQTKARPAAKSSRGSKRSPARSRPSSSSKASASSRKASSAVGKAKVPLLAGGAAIVGAAGGLALGARQGRRGSGIAKAISRRPQVKIRSRDLASAAKDFGSFGAQLGQLATEIQRTRESSNGKHRSPVEVVLEGLTARRGRS